MKYASTTDLCEYLDNLLEQHENGTISNATARVKVSICKAMLDTKKVEIAMAALGRTVTSVPFQKPMKLVG